MEEEEDLTDYIDQVDWSVGQSVDELKQNFEIFKVEKYEKELAKIANKHGLQTADLKRFVEQIMNRMIFDGEKLTDLMEPLELGWKQRSKAETALMKDLIPQLKKLAQGREISGLAAYE
jgi:type I restriction enzyme R subunit